MFACEIICGDARVSLLSFVGQRSRKITVFKIREVNIASRACDLVKLVGEVTGAF